VFVRSAEGFIVKDAGSLNGTYVNRQLVTERTLENGDEVQIGKFRMVFVVPD
jgi:pSer/pThr/pTyr-binding forkhead associated (FHA) protein